MTFFGNRCLPRIVPGLDSLRLRSIVTVTTLWLSIATTSALAVDPGLPFSSYIRTHFTTDDGLPSGVVGNLQQTPDGFLWFVSKGSVLTRFDGQRFHAFAGISAYVIAAAPNGDLWVGTAEGLWRIDFDSLSHFDLSGATFYHPGLGPASNIRSLLFGRDSVLWVGTRQGLFRFDEGQFSPVGPRMHILSIEETARGHLLLTTEVGFMELDNLQVVPLTDLTAQLGTRSEDIFHVMEDSRGNRWCSGVQGVARRTGEQWSKLPPYGPVGHGAFRVYEDPQGNVWVVKTEGLFRVVNDSLELMVQEIEVRSLYGDRDGALWVGTNGDGLYRFKDPAVRMFTTADGLPNDVIMTVLVAHDGSIWTGANCGGLTRFDGTNFHTYDEKDGLLNSCVWTLAEDANHDLWVGTWGGGAFRFHDGRFTHVLDDIVISMVAARDGSIWFGTRAGVVRVRNEETHMFTRSEGLSNNAVFKVFQDRNGRILTGSRGGIDILRGDRFENLPHIPTSKARPIGEDRAGGLYVGFDDLPFTLRLEGDEVDTLPELSASTGLIETESGELWSVGSGIHRLPPGSIVRSRPRDEPLDYERFGIADGLATTEASAGSPNVALGVDGTVWIATPQGLAMFDPHRLPKAHAPTIYMTEVTVGRDTRPAPNELVLSPGTSHFEVSFAAVEIVSPEKIRMQYRLDDFDSEWLDASADPRAIYGNLPPGSHSLHVRACNRNGVWDRVGVTYPIHQQPHFYQTAWFLAAAIATGLMVVGGAYRFRVRQVSRQLRARFEERLAERTRIAGELHDTLLQGVLSACMQLHVASESIPADSPAKSRVAHVRAHMERVIDDARKSVLGLRGARTETVDDLKQAFSRIPDELGGAKGISFHIALNGEPRPLRPLVRDEVYRIGRESLLNAFRHSEARSIEVEITYLDHELSVVVRDDGRGVDGSTLDLGREGHWGLPGMRERAERLGAQLALRSRTGSGTEVELIVPARIAFEGVSSPGRVRRLLHWIFPSRVPDSDGSEL